MDQLERTYGVDRFTIVCNTTGPVESTFMTDPYDETANVEGSPPWTLAGDDGQGNFGSTPFRENVGDWNVTCQPFCGPLNTGNAGETVTVNFDVTACTECTTECIRITDFVLVDSSKNANFQDPPSDYLVYLQEGQTYNLTELEQQFNTNEFALLCITDPLPFAQTPFPVGSVGLRDNVYRTHERATGTNNGKDYNGEGSPPYTLADDNVGDYNPTDFRLGQDWSITCQAFCAGGLQDTAPSSIPVTRNFTMVE